MKSRSAKDYTPADDYYTPKPIFDALGLTFDIDVCAPTGGVPWIPAKKSFDLIIDGLSQDWDGLVWCNPPYSKPGPWIDKFIEHGNGIMLVQISKSNGQKKLWDQCDGMLFPDIKIMKFINLQNEAKSVFMPVALYAMGQIGYQALLASNLGRVR